MKFFSKIQIFGVALATLVAFGISACDEVKSLVASVSIEEPLVTKEYADNGKLYLVIQSQDNDTIIEDVIINRGNCEAARYRRNDDKRKKAGYPRSSKIDVYAHWSITKDTYNTLEDEVKATYDLIYPKKLPYGKSWWLENGCSAGSILEVELVVNGGGRLTYSFK